MPSFVHNCNYFSLNEQVLDLTQDNDGDEVIKEATPGLGSSDVPQISQSVYAALASSTPRLLQKRKPRQLIWNLLTFRTSQLLMLKSLSFHVFSFATLYFVIISGQCKLPFLADVTFFVTSKQFTSGRP